MVTGPSLRSPRTVSGTTGTVPENGRLFLRTPTAEDPSPSRGKGSTARTEDQSSAANAMSDRGLKLPQSPRLFEFERDPQITARQYGRLYESYCQVLVRPLATP